MGEFFLQKRIISFFCTFLCLLGAVGLRVLYLEDGGAATGAAAVQSSRSVTLYQSRAGIFDRDGSPLVNKSFVWKALVFPEEADLSALSGFAAEEGFAEAVKSGAPVVVDTGGRIINGNGIYNFKAPKRYSENPLAAHIIGYVNGGDGASGIEKAYDDMLKAEGPCAFVRYSTDGHGRILSGEEISFEQEDKSKSGIMLTLSTEIQSAAETALRESLEHGAAVVLDAQTGEILAAASVPCFDQNNLAASLGKEGSPFINRAFSAYTVGSTWKLVVAAAAIENGESTARKYDCKSSIEVEGIDFHCHWEYGHGEIDMPAALRVSCNPYFIDLGLSVGGKKILETAENLGFGAGTELAPGLFSAAGSLPSEAELRSPAALASFSFGQGKLTATPLQMAALAAAIANGGCAVTPKLVLGTRDAAGNITFAAEYESNRVMSEATAKKLQKMMISVVEEGSGINAKPESGGAGGKTASAQTGQFDKDGNEIVHAWFVGFYPAESPKYAIAVFAEGMDSGSEFAAPVFKKICDKIPLGEKAPEK